MTQTRKSKLTTDQHNYSSLSACR